ncbi:MAG: GGDEF domain-containing protein [Pseudomonadota bacterium]
MSSAAPFMAVTMLNAIGTDTETSPTHIPTETDPMNERLLRISGILQTTLEIEMLVKLFVREAKAIIDFDSLTYQNSGLNLEYVIGKKQRHSCSYGLDLERESLGEVIVTRKQAFKEEELQLLEKSLCALLYPLRNALMYHQAVHAASKDAMTGVFNRRTMDERVEHEIKLAQRYGHSLSLIVLDIDHFKRVNDTYGHSAGDCLIKALADILKNNARSSDYVFRYGGEEFVMLLPNTKLKGAKLVAERVRKAVESTECVCNETAMRMTVSLGVADLMSNDTRETLFLRTDEALYQAKNSGRNQTVVAKHAKEAAPQGV